MGVIRLDALPSTKPPIHHLPLLRMAREPPFTPSVFPRKRESIPFPSLQAPPPCGIINRGTLRPVPTLPGGAAVAQRTLDPLTLVRIQAGQLSLNLPLTQPQPPPITLIPPELKTQSQAAPRSKMPNLTTRVPKAPAHFPRGRGCGRSGLRPPYRFRG